MANKPFAIQGADLTLGGVNLQAGTTGVVIPGVTRATGYKVEEVNDTGDQTHAFAIDSEVVVIDYVLYNAIVAQATENLYADYTATTDGEGYIDEIKVNGRGTYTSQEATDNAAHDMYAYVGAGSASDRPIVESDWITIPFRPKMRAGEVETIGGGNANTGNITFDNSVIGSTDGELRLKVQDGDEYSVTYQSSNDWEAYVENDNVGPGGAWAWISAHWGNNGYNTPQVFIENQSANGSTKRWTFDENGAIKFPDTSVQTTAYTGQSGGGTPISPLPSWLAIVANTQHLPTLNTDYGWDSLGAWTVNATIGHNNEGTSYPIRTSFTIANNLKSVTTVDFVVDNMGADFGIGVFASGTDPIWDWDGTSGNPGANRIGAQYNGSVPELHGISGGAGSGYELTSTGTYRARLTVLPVDPGVAEITLETLDTSDNVLDTITYTETSFFDTYYKIGFASDQDNGTDKTYFKNLTINIDNSATIHTDTLTGYNSAISAGANVLVNGNETLTLESDGTVTFPDGSIQYTAYPAAAPSSPTLADNTTEEMSDGTQTGIPFTAAPHSVIVIASGCETANSTPALITGITGMGLTWIKRSEYTDPTSNVSQRSEMWYAVNNSNSALTDTITITFDNNVDDQSTSISSWTGCNLTNPWTVSGPSYSNSLNGTGHPTVTMNVAESNTVGIAFFAIPNYGDADNDSDPGYAVGWTDMSHRTNGGAEYWEFINVSYKPFTGPQLNLVVTSSGGPALTPIAQGSTVIADALVGVSGGLNRITNGAKNVVIEADGRLTLGDGASMLGRVNDDDVVLWADDTAEYVGLWYGGLMDLASDDYGPVSSITVGNRQNDDLYRGVGDGGNTNADWDDGPQVNIDLGEKNWHFDGTTGDLTLPQESVKGSFTSISSSDNYNLWFNSSVTGPDGTVYAVGGEGNQGEKWVIAQGKNSTLWKKNLGNQDFGDGSGGNYPWIKNIKYDTQHNMLYAGFDSGSSTGVIGINPGDGTTTSSWVVRVSTNDSAFVTQNAFTVDAGGVPIIAGRSAGGWVSYNNLTGTQGTDLGGNPYVQIDRTALGDLSGKFRWDGGDFNLDLDGTSNWATPAALDTYFNVPVSYVDTPGLGGPQTATGGLMGASYSIGAITGYDGYGIDVDASLWNDTALRDRVLANGNGVQFTLVIGSLTPGVDQTVYTFSSVSDFSVPTGTVYHMDGNWTLVSGTGTVTTSTDILSITYGTVKTYNVSSGVYGGGTRVWYNVEQSQTGTGYQTNDHLRIPGSLLGGVDSTTVHSAIPMTSVDGTYGAYRMFIDMDAYPELSDVVVDMTVNIDSYPGYTGYVTNVYADTGTRRWVFTVTTDMSMWAGNNGLTVSFVTGNDLVFFLDAYGYAAQITGTPSATSYRLVMNQSFTGNGNGTYNIRQVEGTQAFIWSNRWAHTYGSLGPGEEFYDVVYDPVNDTVYAIGYFEENNNHSNCLIMALNNTDGTVKWQKFIGDNNIGNYGYSSSIGVDAVGDVVAIGKNDDGQAMITKLNGGDGTIVWQTVQTNHSNWNNQPTGAVDTNGDVYFGGSYYNNGVGCYISQLTKLNGSNGGLAWSRNIRTTDNRAMYDQYDSFQQPINVGGGQVQWASFVYDQGNDYYDAIAVSIPQDGTGTDTYSRWIYEVDSNFDAIVGNDAFVQDPVTPYTPTDLLTAELTQPSIIWNDQYVIYNAVRLNIGTGLPGIVFADGSQIDQAGITRAFRDTGNNTTNLNFEHNGKFIYFYGSDGNSTVRVPQNSDVALPIGYTVSLILDDFNSATVYVNTNNDTNNDLHIGAVGFSATYSNNNYWRCGSYDNTVGIYTLMKVDTNRWILSGPNVQDDY